MFGNLTKHWDSVRSVVSDQTEGRPINDFDVAGSSRTVSEDSAFEEVVTAAYRDAIEPTRATADALADARDYAENNGIDQHVRRYAAKVGRDKADRDREKTVGVRVEICVRNLERAMRPVGNGRCGPQQAAVILEAAAALNAAVVEAQTVR